MNALLAQRAHLQTNGVGRQRGQQALAFRSEIARSHEIALVEHKDDRLAGEQRRDAVEERHLNATRETGGKGGEIHAIGMQTCCSSV
jgi:hypothetical protein